MKKKIVRMTAILMSAMMLTGFTGCINPLNIDPSDPILEQQKPESYETVTEKAVNLTDGKVTDDITVILPEEAYVSKLSTASMDLFAQILADEGKNSNVLISPLSIMMALGMTENGAANNTLAQMEQYVNGGIDVETMNAVMAFYKNKMNASEAVSWNVANSLWIKDNGQILPKEKFLVNTASYYGAEAYKAPFSEQTLKEINAWVNKNTNEMIPEILDEINPNSFMYLVNAIAFEGQWEEQFSDNAVREDMDFTNADGSVSKVTMLQHGEDCYFELEGGIGFVKPYAGGEYSFVGILPKEGESTAEYIAKIAKNKDDFAAAVKNPKTGDVVIRLPEFTNDYGTDLKNAYSKLGMNEPFSNGADFTNMLENGGSEAYIGKIIHKTHIEVDRKGTKAAAATIVDMRVKGAIMMPDEVIYIYLDKPFVYAIVDNETGLPVFIGCQNSMK